MATGPDTGAAAGSAIGAAVGSTGNTSAAVAEGCAGERDARRCQPNPPNAMRTAKGSNIRMICDADFGNAELRAGARLSSPGILGISVWKRCDDVAGSGTAVLVVNSVV
jgi:hypothetical protein